MDINKVLFISQEIAPYLPDSEMATASRMLAQGVQEKGIEVRTFMPKYGSINERRNQLHEVIRLSGMNLIIDDTDHPLVIKVATLQPARLQVYFIYNEDYFNPNITKELEIDSHPEDNDERSIFYVRGVLETVKKLRWIPSVIQCSGWVTALAPLYIKKFYSDDPSYRDTKVVMSLFDEKMVAPLDEKMAEKLKCDGFTDEDLAPIFDKQASYIDLMKLAIDNCDAVMQCSPNVDPEVLKLVEDSKLPFLAYQEGENVEMVNRCMDFYHSL
ncbi:MAG: glycogen/starch synthase [Muribaculaceae bacterium]|nr:glycogen/starch synthase [Muribaculaceae bacterium]